MYEADLHTHTVASGHAFGTVMENAKAAADKGLKVIAMTDHGPAAGGPQPYYFLNLRVVPQDLLGVRILKSVEANIIDTVGTLDLRREVLNGLDLVVAGLHLPKLAEKAEAEDVSAWYTEALCSAIRNPYVDIIAHPGNPAFPVNAEKIVKTAAEFGKALEINNNSFIARPGSIDRCNRIAHLCAKYGTLVSIASDAHFPLSIGEVGQAEEMAKVAGIKPEQVVNATEARLARFLSERARRLGVGEDTAAS